MKICYWDLSNETLLFKSCQLRHDVVKIKLWNVGNMLKYLFSFSSYNGKKIQHMATGVGHAMKKAQGNFGYFSDQSKKCDLIKA